LRLREKVLRDPLTIIGEILGDPADCMRNPVNAGYHCPFIDSVCTKRGHHIGGPYPVCSIHRSARDQSLVCICPKRFYEADFLNDVIKHCWRGTPPTNPRFAYEVKMSQFGNVDCVIADVDKQTQTIREFISVELQAVDLTGTVEPAYTAVVSNIAAMAEVPSYGVNWANVRKRYIAQLITKGFYHHHWGTRMVSVIQTQLYNQLKTDIHFDELPPEAGTANIIFMMYDFKPAPEKELPGAQKMVLDKVVGTSHHSLMMASLYHTPPPKDEFCKKIWARLNININEPK
jgi:hypothetical protein